MKVRKIWHLNHDGEVVGVITPKAMHNHSRTYLLSHRNADRQKGLQKLAAVTRQKIETRADLEKLSGIGCHYEPTRDEISQTWLVL